MQKKQTNCETLNIFNLGYLTTNFVGLKFSEFSLSKSRGQKLRDPILENCVYIENWSRARVI